MRGAIATLKVSEILHHEELLKRQLKSRYNVLISDARSHNDRHNNRHDRNLSVVRLFLPVSCLPTLRMEFRRLLFAAK